MTTVIIGVIGGALFFAVFVALRPRDREDGCTGNCIGCLRDGHGACEYRERETAGAHHERDS